MHNSKFGTSASTLKKAAALPPRPTLPDHELKHTYLKGSGPGGQKINKTNSAAQLTHLPTGLVVKCQATRSRSQNHTIAKRLLAEKVEMLEKGQDSRAAKVVERKQKRKRSADKKKRRKYRALAGEEGKVGGSIGDEDLDEEEGLEDQNQEGEEEEEEQEAQRDDEVNEVQPSNQSSHHRQSPLPRPASTTNSKG